MKKFILPVAMVVFGAGAAFATSQEANAQATIQKGYRITSNPAQPCVQSSKMCSTIPSPYLCKEGGVTLHQLNGTSCGNNLFEL